MLATSGSPLHGDLIVLTLLARHPTIYVKLYYVLDFRGSCGGFGPGCLHREDFVAGGLDEAVA